jgi:N-acetylmuramoyl-L-alanine amidase
MINWLITRLMMINAGESLADATGGRCSGRTVVDAGVGGSEGGGAVGEANLVEEVVVLVNA